MTTEPSIRITRMRRVLQPNHSSFYKWVRTRKKRRLKVHSDGLIGAKIRSIFDDENGLYVTPTHRCNLERGHGVYPGKPQKSRTHHQKPWGSKGLSKHRRCITTRPKPGHRVMPDLLGHKFTANELNRVYVGNITYLPCKGGTNMYLATVIDTYSRKLAGYALADHMRGLLVIDALSHAHGVRGSLDGAVFH